MQNIPIAEGVVQPDREFFTEEVRPPHRAELLKLAREDVPGISEAIRPFLQRTADRMDGRLTVEFLMDELLKGAGHLWIVMEDGRIRLAAVTTILSYPSGLKCCQILVLAGHDVRRWMSCAPVLENWARGRGCKRIETYARPGWERLAGDYRKKFILLEKEI